MTRLRSLLQTAAEIQGSTPLRNRDTCGSKRVKAKLEWRKTKWGRRDDWQRK